MFSFLGDFIEDRNLSPPIVSDPECKYLKLLSVFFLPTLLKGQKHFCNLSYDDSGSKFFVLKHISFWAGLKEVK